MIRAAWFRRRPPPRQSMVRPICWQGVALLVGGILMANAPVFFVDRYGVAAFWVWMFWFPACLAILFAMVARRTEA